MSKKVDISKNVMDQIHGKNIKIKPKIFFILGSLLVFSGLVISIIGSVFLITLTGFMLKTHGPMGQYRFEQLISSFPWWAPLLSVAALLLGILLLRRYDFSYKKNFYFIVLGLVIAVIASGLLIDYLNLDDYWFRKGPMKRLFNQQEFRNMEGPNFKIHQEKPRYKLNQ